MLYIWVGEMDEWDLRTEISLIQLSCKVVIMRTSQKPALVLHWVISTSHVKGGSAVTEACIIIITDLSV